MKGKWFWIGGVMVLLLLVSLGGCAISDTTTNRETAVTAEIDQIFDDYITAFNNYDLEAAGAVLADGYMLYETSWHQTSSVSTPPSRDYDRATVLSNVELWYPGEEIQWERLGEAIMTGDDPWLVSQVIHASSNNPLYPNGIEGVSILTIIDENGTLKVARDVFVAFEVK
ncbi:MAG: hypothetical protein ACW97O_12410 [Candidatus Thorarchaeota archaeon]|jgi:hypothetical protein